MKLKTNLKYTSRKTIALLIIVAFLLPSFSLIIMVAAEEQTFQNITVDTAYQMIKKENKYPNLIILDVRTPCEYEKGHLYDAILIPYNELEFEAGISELEGYKNSEIIVYCKSGYRSTLASEILVENGFTNIYNMLGGILAWIDADYPIWTTQHYITVDGIEEPIIQIEPLLLYLTGYPCCTDNQGSCTSCTDNQECPDDSESITITSTVLEQDENHIVILLIYELDGTIYEFTVVNTLLWSYNELTNEINRTAYFYSNEIIIEDMSIQFYQLYYLVQHEEYNLTLYTWLTPLNSETYNNSFTIISYEPADEKFITSMEIVKFNSPVTFSQQYAILGKVSEEMAKIYEKSGDESLAQLVRAYNTMEKEAKFLSKLVKKQLSEYNMQILESLAILTDVCGDPLCLIVCNVILLFGYGAGTTLICTAACGIICGACAGAWYTCVACVLCIAGCGGLATTLGALVQIYGIEPGCWWFCCQI